MTSGIILNPNQELVLRQKQNEILKSVNIESAVLHPLYPFFLIFESPELKELSPSEIKKILKSVEIEKIIIKNGKFFFEVKITVFKENKEICHYEKIPFALLNEKISLSDGQKKLIFNFQENFKMTINSFRLAQIKRASTSWEIWNDIWCKIK